MTTVLIYTTPGKGHLYPIMDTALTLAARGHDVRVRTLQSEVETVRKTGLSARPIAAAVEACALDDWRVSTPAQSAERSLSTFVTRAALEVDDLQAAIAEEAPRLLLIDTNAWGAQAVAQASGLPWAIWHPFPLPLPSRDVPPFGPGFAPARGLPGRLRDWLLRPLLTAPLRKCLPRLNEVRRRVGVAPIVDGRELFAGAHLVLYLTAEPFEYPRSDWPDRIELVGPGLWSPPSTGPRPAWCSGEKPVVLVTCSTEYQNDGALLDAAIAAFGEDPSVQLVCTTAGVDPATVRAPKGVVVERFFDHATVLPRADVVVCHGGMGITQRALAAGVPVCVVPWGRDQLEVGRRVVVAGAGSMVPRSKLTAARLKSAVEEARGRRPGVERVKAGYAAAGGTARSVELLEGLVPVSAASSTLPAAAKR
jgi:MGT family glycosyltransferase